MKLLITLLILAYSIPFIALSQSDLNKVWEVRYKMPEITVPRVNNIFLEEDKYRFVIEGGHPQFGYKSPGMIEINLQGNLLKIVNSALQMQTYPYSVKVMSDKYVYFSTGNGKISIFTSDLNGDSLAVSTLDMPESFYVISNVVINNNTIIVFVEDSDKRESYLYFFDEEFNKIDEIKLEKSNNGLTIYPINWFRKDTLRNEFKVLHLGPAFYPSGFSDYFVIVNYDSSGNIIWETEFSLPDEQQISYRHISILNNGNVAIVYMISVNDKQEFYVLELDNDGQLISKNKLADDLTTVFSGSFKEISNDRIAFMGWRNKPTSANFLKIFNTKGEILNNYEWKGKPQIGNLFELESGNLICTSSIHDSLWILEVSLTPVSVSDNNNFQSSNFKILPNPANDFITIQLCNKELQLFAPEDKVQIFDMLGFEIMSELIHPMTGSHRMNVEKLPTGVYFIRIGNKVEKFVKI